VDVIRDGLKRESVKAESVEAFMPSSCSNGSFSAISQSDSSVFSANFLTRYACQPKPSQSSTHHTTLMGWQKVSLSSLRSQPP
jgi:hypothetical protein